MRSVLLFTMLLLPGLLLSGCASLDGYPASYKARKAYLEFAHPDWLAMIDHWCNSHEWFRPPPRRPDQTVEDYVLVTRAEHDAKTKECNNAPDFDRTGAEIARAILEGKITLGMSRSDVYAVAGDSGRPHFSSAYGGEWREFTLCPLCDPVSVQFHNDTVTNFYR